MMPTTPPAGRLRAVAAVLPLVLLVASDARAQWTNAPRLHNPTRSSVTLAGVPAVDLEVRLAETPERVDCVRADELWSRVVPAPARVTVEHRRAHSDARWESAGVFRLRPLPPPEAASVTVAIASDTHAWALASKEHPAFPGNGLELVRRVMTNVADAAPDLLVHNGDFSMTWCSGCDAVAPLTSAGSSASLADALHRTRTVWGADLLGRAGSVAALPVLGDHEGLMPWVSEPDGPTASLGAWSAEALARTIPAPRTSADGSFVTGPAGSTSWALRAGSLLLVGLDVQSAMLVKPVQPEDWQLAPEHLAWFEAVLSVPAEHKVVVAEHMLGGISGPGNGHWKGRSSLRATDDGTVHGRFLGQQAALHALMTEHGGDVFLTGHDHVAVLGTKDGVTYVTGGVAGGIGGTWINQAWFQAALDYDGDGVPEYDTDVTGTRKPGHFELEAVSGGPLRLRYVLAALGPANGNEVLHLELPP